MTLFPGDRALVVSDAHCASPELHPYVGQTVTVVGNIDGPLGLWHEVCACDGVHFAARPKALQKLPPPPPREQTGDWNWCMWRPADMVVA